MTVVSDLKKKGVPIIGNCVLEGVEYGSLEVTSDKVSQ